MAATLLSIAAMEVAVCATEPCELIRVDDAGRLVVRLQGVEQALAIFGIDVDQPPRKEYVDLVADRIPRTSRTLQCTVVDAGPPPRARFLYLAWRDKSGDVWQDLALSLLELGQARVSDERFPGRDEYLRHARPPR